MENVNYAKGLEGVIAAESEICRIDGESGKLYYRGYSIEDLAENSTFEEGVYLLLYEKLPSEVELHDFTVRMRESRGLAKPILQMIKSFPHDGNPMELLQSVISYLSGYVTHKIKHSATCNCRQTLHQVAQLASVLAAYERFKQGKEYIPPRTDLSHGANFLYMLLGEVPGKEEGRMMDTALLLHAEHGFNASTFTARVVASTLSTCYCSISAAVGALYGSLHGGANARVLNMLDEIGSTAHVEEWIDEAIAAKRKVMGMGHRVYRAKDPRAKIMEGFLEKLAAKKHNTRNLDLLRAIENSMTRRMEAQGKKIYPNVDFFSGSVYSLLGIPRELFTPIFAMARVSGWLAHILEQRKDNRIYRPRCLYKGAGERAYTQVEKR